MKRRFFAMLLSLAMLFTLAPTAFAAGNTEANESQPTTESQSTTMGGTCGATGNKDSVNWELTQNNDDSEPPTYTLTISGEGAMADYNSNIGNKDATQPWRAGQTGIDITAITKIVVEQGVTKIGDFAFNGITNVTEYDIAATVTDIGRWGLETSSVEHFYLNKNPNYTVDSDGVLLNADKTELIAYPGGAEARDSYTIPSTVTTVASGAFVGCDAAKLVIPSTVTSLPQWSFNGGTIQEIVCNTETLPESVFPNIKTLEKISFGSAIKTLPKQAVFGCSNLRDVTLPDGLTSIGEQAFKDCTALSGIKFPASLESIGNQAFINCTALSGIEFPEGLTTIGSQAFYHCSALTALVFPDSLTTIGANAFNGCTDLQYVVHGSGIDDIGGSAFSGCISLKVIDIHRAVKIGEKWDNGDPNRGGDSALNNACPSNLENVCYYMRSETQAKAAKGDIEWGSSGAGTGNTTNTYYALTEKDAVPDYSGENNNIPIRIGYTFSGWKNVNSTIENVYTDAEQWTKNSYIADADTATINQKAGDSGTPNGSATLEAPKELTYDGQPKVAVVETTGTWTGGENVTYAKKGESESIYTDNAPVAAGTYTARLTVGDAVVSVEFEITKATPTISISADKTSLSGGDQVKLTVTGAPTDEGSVNVTCDNGITVTKNKDGTFSATLPNQTKTYTFTASYTGAENGNYSNTSAECTVAVTHHSSGSSNPTYSVTTPSKSENGGVAVSSKNARKGDTVTVTVTPDAGYQLDKLTITDKNGEELKLTDKGDGQYTFTMPDGKVEVKAVFVKKVETRPFGDVSADAYYNQAVQWAQEKGITDGISNDLFGPKQPCTRSQIVTFLWRAAGSPEPKGTAAGMTDVVPGSYYAKAVAWAVENGITTGTAEGTFSPNATCTRAQAVTFLARAQNAKATGKTAFSDVPADSYFADAVAWAQANGVTTGTSETTFSPDSDCTRAQIVTFLYRANQGT